MATLEQLAEHERRKNALVNAEIPEIVRTELRRASALAASVAEEVEYLATGKRKVQGKASSQLRMSLAALCAMLRGLSGYHPGSDEAIEAVARHPEPER